MQRKLASAEWLVVWDSAVLCWWEHADHWMSLPVQRKGRNFLPWGNSSHFFENSVGSRSSCCPMWSMTASWMDFAKRRAALSTPQCLQVSVAAKSRSGHSGASYSPKNSTPEPPMPCTKARSSCWIASAGTLEQVASMLASYDQQAMLASQSLQECGRNQGASLISDMCVGACQELLAAAFPWSSNSMMLILDHSSSCEMLISSTAVSSNFFVFTLVFKSRPANFFSWYCDKFCQIHQYFRLNKSEFFCQVTFQWINVQLLLPVIGILSTLLSPWICEKDKCLSIVYFC